MVGEWITGKEIMDEYGKAAIQIGRACYDGVLQAYTADILTPVLEESKLVHYPSYPPPGVNPYDHPQYTVTPSWDWSGYMEETGKGIHARVSKGLNPEAVARVLRENDIPGLRMEASIGIAPEENMVVQKHTLRLMDKGYFYSTDFPCDVNVFCFLYSDFSKWHRERVGYKPDAYTIISVASDSEIIKAYKQTIGDLLFKRNEVEAWLGIEASTIPAEPITTPDQSPPAIVEAVEEVPNDKHKLAQNPTLSHVMKNKITYKEAAERAGVRERTIFNWVKGKGRPHNFPGLHSRSEFVVFAEGYKINKELKGDTRARNRASPRGDIENFPDEEDSDY